MKEFAKRLCWMLALTVPILFGLRAGYVLAEGGAGRLTILLTNVTDEALVDYDRVVVPVVPAEGGVFAVPVICYCGPAVMLGVEECGTNSLLVESSVDLTNWAPFPQPGFQLRLDTNSPAVIPVTGTNRFFRGRLE